MAMPIAHHVIMRLSSGRVLCTDAASRRRSVRGLLEVGERHGLLSTKLADTHIHVLLACDRPSAGRFARAVERSLRARLPASEPFEPARFIEVRDQWHLIKTFPYVLRQERRHGTDCDPFHDGSNLLDLVGARIFAPRGSGSESPGATCARLVRILLPRVRREDLLAELGIGPGCFGVDLRLEDLSIAELAEAAAAAVGIATIRGVGRSQTAARIAAIQAAAALEPLGRSGPCSSSAALAAAFGISRRAVQQARHLLPAPGIAQAVALQLRMRRVHRAAQEARAASGLLPWAQRGPSVMSGSRGA